MKNNIYALIAGSTTSRLRMVLTVLSLFSLAAMPLVAAQANVVTCQLVQIYSQVLTAIFVLGLMLMILGGALYAASHIMPGQSKGQLQGYGMGMVIGGVIGVVIAVIGPYALSLIAGNSVANIVSGGQAACG
jgi:fumarate reductase subunit D